MKTLRGPWWKAHVARNWGLLQTAKWTLSSGFSSPSSAFRWLHAWLTAYLHLDERPWARTVHLGCSHIPDLQKLCEIVNVCCFKLLNLRAICYATMHDRYTPPALLRVWVQPAGCSVSLIYATGFCCFRNILRNVTFIWRNPQMT